MRLFSPMMLLAAASLSAQVQTPAPAPARNAPPKEVAGIPVNYDESLTGSYTLPPLLTLANGKPVEDAKTWNNKRRPEIIALLEEHQFGRAPERPKDLTFEVFDTGTPAMNGKALRRQITIHFTADKAKGPKADVVLYLPAGAKKKVPVLLTVNFSPNAAIFDDAGLKLGETWNREKKRVPAQRGTGLGRLKIDDFLAKGIAVAGVYYGDIDPDFQGGIPHGVRATYLAKGQDAPASNEWGTISAWAWGLSRVLDYFETDKAVNAKKVALYGISRLGKTVLWTGARDTRFAAVIASCSGEGGAAVSRRNYGETVGHLTAPLRYPYQFAGNYANYGKDVNAMPVDAHMLVAAIAPRPLFLQTGDGDLWSDPKGEFLAAVAATPVYQLLGKQGLPTDKMPAAGEPLFNTLTYHMHAGGHTTLPGDWALFLKFLEQHLIAH